MKGSWWRLAAVGLCVVAVAGLFSAAGAQTTSAVNPPHTVAATKGAALGNDVSKATWMHDLAPHLWYRKLDQVVIPGSHDSASWDLWEDPLGPYAVTQNEDITGQLNDGARNFDIRVEGVPDGDYVAHHGIVSAPGVTLTEILDQIKNWTLQPSHDQEVLLVHLIIDQDGNPFPDQTCSDFDRELGSALLTPAEAQAHFGTTDPAQLTFGQLWSLQGTDYPQGPPRVIMDNPGCLADVHAGQWSGTATADGGLFGGYYADQCYAQPYTLLGDGKLGILNPTIDALNARATQGGGDDHGNAMNLGPSKPGGFYDVGIEATPTQDCYIPLHWLLNEDRAVLAGIYQQWQYDLQGHPAGLLANINILSGDYIQETDLVQDAIAMDETYPVEADSITSQGPDTVTVEQDQTFPTGSFLADVSYQGQPVDQAQVTYTVSNESTFGPGPTVNGAATATVTSTNGLVDLDGLGGAAHIGTWKLTASLPDSASVATWTLEIVPSTHYTLQKVSGPNTVQADDVTRESGHKHRPMGFIVVAVNAAGRPVPDVAVTFDAAAANGTFPDGAKTVTATTANDPYRDDDGEASAPPFTAGTRAGPVSILVSAPGAPTLAMPLTVMPFLSSAALVPLTGNLQSTPINTTFPIPLTGHFADAFGNVLTRADLALELDDGGSSPLSLSVDPHGEATWPNGSDDFELPLSSVAPDGTISAPPLRAGQTVQPNTFDQLVKVFVDGFPRPWEVGITPGPPDSVTATNGDGQHTGKAQKFAQDLAVKVTDAGGNPIPGAPVTFAVTSGQATFPAPNLADLAKVRDTPTTNTPNPSPTTVTVAAGADGVATAPDLTTGQQAGQLVVTASAGTAPAVKSTDFHLSVDAVPPAKPTVKSVANDDNDGKGGQVTVDFSEDSPPGTPAASSYTVTAVDETNAANGGQTATGRASPITLGGLTNGERYHFTVTAIGADGAMSEPSDPSNPINVGVPSTLGAPSPTASSVSPTRRP